MIPFSPSIGCPNPSGEIRPIFSSRRKTDKVRTRLILTQDFFGKSPLSSSSVRGYPARCGWPVIAMAITVPECSLKTSWLMTTTGLRPACSCPFTGFKSAQTISPLVFEQFFELPRQRFISKLLLKHRILLGTFACQYAHPVRLNGPVSPLFNSS
jgi:hypothetical protein